MKAPAQAILCILLSLAAAPAAAGPADDLLPPPVRQAEKRSLVANNVQRNYYDGRGAIGAAFSPDGKLLVTGSAFQGMTLWDVGAGRVLSQLPTTANNGGLSAVFTPNGQQLVVANWGGPGMGLCPVAVWDVAKRERIRSLDDDVNDTAFTAAAAAPDGKTLALAGACARKNGAPAVCLWDLASGDEVGRIEGLIPLDPTRRLVGGGFAALAYSPDGRTLAVLLEERVVLVEVATGKPRGQFTLATRPATVPNGQGMTLGALAFSPDGRTLAAGCSDGAVRRFDLRAGRELTPLPAHTGFCPCPMLPARRQVHPLLRPGRSILRVAHRSRPRVEAEDRFAVRRRPRRPLGRAQRRRRPRPLWLHGGAGRRARAGRAVPAEAPGARPKEDAARIDRLIQDMQKGDYNARKKAVIELRKVGAAALPSLQRMQQMGGYDELAQRLVFEFTNLPVPPEQLRAERALSVLERVGDAEARKLLEELAGGAPEARLTIEAKAALGRLGEARTAKPAATPDALWDALAAEDGATAYEAIRALAGRPGAAALLHDRLNDVVAKDTFDDEPKRVAKLIGDLDSDDFAVREQASKDLRNLGRFIIPSLRKALEAKPGDEVQRRLTELLDAAAKAAPPPEVLRVGRALER